MLSQWVVHNYYPEIPFVLYNQVMSSLLKLKNILTKLKVPLVVAIGVLAVLFSPSLKMLGGEGIVHADTPTSCGGGGDGGGSNGGGGWGGGGDGGGSNGGGENSPGCMCQDASCPQCAGTAGGSSGASCGSSNCSSQCSSPGMF